MYMTDQVLYFTWGLERRWEFRISYICTFGHWDVLSMQMYH